MPMDASKIQKTCFTDTAKAGERITQLSSLRVLACVGIVILHTVFAANEYFMSEISSMENMLSRMVENNMMWAVPTFVMVTGVLQLDSRKKLTWRKLYSRYMLRIVIALTACCILFRIFDMLMDGEPMTFAGLLKAFEELVTAKCWGHLWYLYLLIGLYVLLPFYRMITEHATDRELLYLCGAYGLFVSIIPMIEGFGLHVGFYISESIIYPLYLLLGHMIYAERIMISRRAGLLLLVGSTMLILLMDYLKYAASADLPAELFGYASPIVIVQTIGFFSLVCKGRQKGERRLLTVLDGCSFGVYLIHMVFIRLLFRYMEWNPYETEWPFLALTAVVFGIMICSLGIVWILKRIPGIRWIL